jgi:ribosomal protein S27AE
MATAEQLLRRCVCGHKSQDHAGFEGDGHCDGCHGTPNECDSFRLPPPNGVWQCPACGWIMSNEQYLAAAYNYPCGRCGATTLINFRQRGSIADAVKYAPRL